MTSKTSVIQYKTIYNYCRYVATTFNRYVQIFFNPYFARDMAIQILQYIDDLLGWRKLRWNIVVLLLATLSSGVRRAVVTVIFSLNTTSINNFQLVLSFAVVLQSPPTLSRSVLTISANDFVTWDPGRFNTGSHQWMFTAHNRGRWRELIRTLEATKWQGPHPAMDHGEERLVWWSA